MRDIYFDQMPTKVDIKRYTIAYKRNEDRQYLDIFDAVNALRECVHDILPKDKIIFSSDPCTDSTKISKSIDSYYYIQKSEEAYMSILQYIDNEYEISNVLPKDGIRRDLDEVNSIIESSFSKFYKEIIDEYFTDGMVYKDCVLYDFFILLHSLAIYYHLKRYDTNVKLDNYLEQDAVLERKLEIMLSPLLYYMSGYRRYLKADMIDIASIYNEMINQWINKIYTYNIENKKFNYKVFSDMSDKILSSINDFFVNDDIQTHDTILNIIKLIRQIIFTKISPDNFKY